MLQNNSQSWSQKITEASHALDLGVGVFAWDDPRRIALSLKHSVDMSQQRKSGPFASEMAMLNFDISRAGKHLSDR